MLAGGKGLREDLGRGMLSADDLDDDVDARVTYDVTPIGGELLRGDSEFAGARLVEAAGAGDAQVDAVGPAVFLGMGFDQLEDAATDGTQADESDVDGAGALVHDALLYLLSRECARRG